MKLGLYFCLFCIFIQYINAESFSIQVPLSPFSLGELSFIIIGLFNIIRKTRFNSIITYLLIIYVSGLFAAFVNEDTFINFSRPLGILISLIATLGLFYSWINKEYSNVLKIFFSQFYILLKLYSFANQPGWRVTMLPNKVINLESK